MTLQDLLRLGSGGSAQADQTYSLADILKAAQQYDPGAHVQTSGGGDDPQVQSVAYDMRALPKYADGTQYGQVNGSGSLINSPVFSGGMARQATEGLLNPKAVTQDANYGTVTPWANVKQHTEKQGMLANVLDHLVPQTATQGLLGIAGLGLAGAGLTGLQSGAAKLGLGALASGGKSLASPSTWLSTGLGAAGAPSWASGLANFGLSAATNKTAAPGKPAPVNAIPPAVLARYNQDRGG